MERRMTNATIVGFRTEQSTRGLHIVRETYRISFENGVPVCECTEEHLILLRRN